MFHFFRNIFKKIVRIPKVVRGKDIFIKIDFECEHITLGNSDKLWTICPFFLNEDSVVYSFGVGYNISFNLEMINHFDVKVYVFDPTPKSIEWLKKQNLPKQLIQKEYGLAHFNGKAKFYPSQKAECVSATLLERKETENEAYKVYLKTVKTIMNELNHKQIDLLKLNVAGAEYMVVNDMIKSEVKPAQLIIEFHHKFDDVGINKTVETINKLRDYGYMVFHISTNGEKISFISKELGGF